MQSKEEAKLENQKADELKIKLDFEISKMGLLVPIQCSKGFVLDFSNLRGDSPMYVMIRRPDYKEMVRSHPIRSSTDEYRKEWRAELALFRKETEALMGVIECMLKRVKLGSRISRDKTSIRVYP